MLNSAKTVANYTTPNDSLLFHPQGLYQYEFRTIWTPIGLLASKFELAALNEGAVPSNMQLGTNGKIYLTLNFAYFYDYPFSYKPP